MFRENHIGFSKPASSGEFEPRNQREKTILDRFRNRILAGFMLGTAAFLEACGGLKKEEMDKLDLIRIENVIEKPEAYTEKPLIKVRGYGIKVPEKKSSLLHALEIVGDAVAEDEDIEVKTTREVFEIHETPDPKSPHIQAMAETLTIQGIRVTPEIKFTPNHRYHIAGTLKQKRTGKNIQYYFKISQNMDVQGQQETPEK